MKKIGIIGGAGPLASSLLYRKIVEKCYLAGCKHSGEIPEMVIINYPFTREHCITTDPMKKPLVIDLLQHCVNELVAVNVDILVIACNTLHLFINDIELHGKKFIHIAQTALNSKLINHVQDILIVGTSTTMQNKLFNHSKIVCHAPPEKSQLIIDDIIGRILEGKLLQADSILLDTIIKEECIYKHYHGVILGCTELPVLYDSFPFNKKSNIIIIDTINELAQVIVQTVTNKLRIKLEL
jgi:aspartate racemase